MESTENCSDKDKGISSVIGVILLVAITVALVALVTIVAFNIGGDVSNSPNAAVQIQETSSGIQVTVLRNENVEEFRVEYEDGTSKSLDRSTGSTESIGSGNGGYDVIAVLADGTEKVLRSTEVTSADSGDGSGDDSGTEVSGRVSGSTIQNATVEVIKSDGTISATTTTDSDGNYTISVDNPDSAEIRVNFNENSGSTVTGTGSTTVVGGGLKSINSRDTVNFNFSRSENPVVDGLNINGTINQVRYLNDTNGYYEITNIHQLQAMSDNLGVNYEIVSDINASKTQQWNSGSGYDPLGTGADPYDIQMDGNGYEIKGLYIDRPSDQYVGIFGALSSSSNIQNFSLTGADVTADSRAGTVVGFASDGSEIRNIHATGIVTGGLRTGGLAGFMNGILTNSSADVSVKATGGYIGGLVGESSDGIIRDSHATGSVEPAASESGSEIAVGSKSGGLLGYGDNTTIADSYATGDVELVARNNIGSGPDDTGGLVGFLRGGGTVKDSYATGDVVSGSDVGGLVGTMRDEVVRSYAEGDVYGQYQVGGLVGSGLGNITNTYANGEVVGDTSNTGGLAGDFQFSSDYTLSNSYSSGAVIDRGVDDDSFGGFVGGPTDAQVSIDESDIQSSYWIDTDSSDDATGAVNNSAVNGIEVASASGVDYTLSEVKGSSAETSASNLDFSTIWTTRTDDFPTIQD